MSKCDEDLTRSDQPQPGSRDADPRGDEYIVERSHDTRFGQFEWMVLHHRIVVARSWHQKLADDIARALTLADGNQASTESSVLNRGSASAEKELLDPPLAPSERVAQAIERICLRIAELPDRTSPDDWPEAMLVTSEELSNIIRDELTSVDYYFAAIRPASAPVSPAPTMESYMPIAADLLPCPFCGEKAVLTNVRMSGHSFAIGCVNELCWRPRTDYFDTQDAVVAAWNQRSVSPAPQEYDKALGAGLIGQAIPDVDGTLPRLRLLKDIRRASELCDEMIGPGTYQTRMIALAMIARQYLREIGKG